MLRAIPEPDWKAFRKLHPIVLERWYEHSLTEIDRRSAREDQTPGERYHDIADFIRESRKELTLVFDDIRRSTALDQLVAMRARDLLTDEELALFSAETQAVVESITDWALGKPPPTYFPSPSE